MEPMEVSCVEHTLLFSFLPFPIMMCEVFCIPLPLSLFCFFFYRLSFSLCCPTSVPNQLWIHWPCFRAVFSVILLFSFSNNGTQMLHSSPVSASLLYSPRSLISAPIKNEFTSTYFPSSSKPSSSSFLSLSFLMVMHTLFGIPLLLSSPGSFLLSFALYCAISATN